MTTREKEMAILRMYYKEEELFVVTSTKSDKFIDQVPEDMITVSESEIRAINAHTLSDVLYHVPGISLDLRGGPGAATVPSIQGSDMRQVLIVVDGVVLNNLGAFAVNTGSIPVKNIRKIEIIRGPASSVWGSSLGGVINIITKGDWPNKKLEGAVSGSYGEADTTDSYVEATGKAGNMKYYVDYNKLRTNGLTANTPNDADHFYTKLKFDLSDNVDLLFTLGYFNGDTGEGEMVPYDIFFHNWYSRVFSTMGLGVDLWQGARFDLALKEMEQNFENVDFQRSTGTENARNFLKDSNYGVNAKFSLAAGAHQLVTGMDYDHGQLESNAFTEGNTHLLKRWAAFVNDTIRWNDFTFVPGFRYDHADTSGGFMSPSIGLTYQPMARLLLRSTVARGFNIPPLNSTFGTGPWFVPNPSLTMEKIRSYQVGVETILVPYVWLRTGLFRHEISGAITSETLSVDPFQSTVVNKSSQRRQGFEAEAKTVKFYNITLNAGFVFTDVKDLDTKTYLEMTPRHTIDVGAQYSDPLICQATLKGHYILWTPHSLFQGNYDSFIWDLHLSREVYGREWGDVELFLSARNLFNSSQYLIEFWKNPGRWVEGGVRVNF
ncbi:MAG: TonB-dependent receptor [Nitrospinae bacterium]|nr:TonB-dependent receptor [Nitrospinota bacterium]